MVHIRGTPRVPRYILWYTEQPGPGFIVICFLTTFPALILKKVQQDDTILKISNKCFQNNLKKLQKRVLKKSIFQTAIFLNLPSSFRFSSQFTSIESVNQMKIFTSFTKEKRIHFRYHLVERRATIFMVGRVIDKHLR